MRLIGRAMPRASKYRARKTHSRACVWQIGSRAIGVRAQSSIRGVGNQKAHTDREKKLRGAGRVVEIRPKAR